MSKSQRHSFWGWRTFLASYLPLPFCLPWTGFLVVLWFLTWSWDTKPGGEASEGTRSVPLSA